MIRYLLTLLAIGIYFPIQAQNDTLKNVTGFGEFTVGVFDSFPDSLFLVEMTDESDQKRDTITIGDKSITSLQAGNEVVYVAIYDKGLWKIIYHPGPYQIWFMDIATARINNELCLRIDYHYRDANWYYGMIYDHTLVVDISDTPECILNVTTTANDFFIDTESKYSENDHVRDCDCKQPIAFLNGGITIYPKDCADEVGFSGKVQVLETDCLTALPAGNFKWTGEYWLRTE